MYDLLIKNGNVVIGNSFEDLNIGIKNNKAALIAKKNGMNVIMDKCPKIENQRLFGELRVAGFNTRIISSKIDL